LTTSSDQYLPKSLHRYEWIFGRDFLNSGGIDATKALAASVAISPRTRILDVGSGLGGSAFYLCSVRGADVTGVDVLESMVKESTARAAASGLKNVRFICGDVLIHHFERADFDVVWSQDAFLHIPDKRVLLDRLFRLLRPGGQLVFTDYARGRGRGGDEFEEYASNYALLTPDDYATYLKTAGFADVACDNATEEFVKYLREELAQIESGKNSAGETIDESDRRYLLERWQLKLRCCEAGDMGWAKFRATRP
jgi:phosphoethanolamine N-methyltransferase